MFKLFYLIFLLFIISFSKVKNFYQFEGIYFIKNLFCNSYFSIKNNQIELKSNHISYFKIININNDSYYIQSIFFNKKLGTNKYGKIILDKNIDKNHLNFQWNIINIYNKEFLIQNKYNKKLLEVNNNYLKFSEDNNLLTADSKKKFLFIKLFEENKNKREFLRYILKEPIDVIIKYIDLNDKTLNRSGIKQTYKDKDNEELRYCLKSILQYIPWVRKIYILMPNELVKYLKSSDEIKDKIIYIKDKNLIGFDSANIQAFLFNLYKTENFGISKNFIYMEDDYFIGKKLFKNNFFYYEEKNKKVVPYIISYFFKELNKSILFDNYFDLFKKRNLINPHTNEGFRLQIYNTEKFILENHNRSLIKVAFTHNAIPENINDLKEIYNKSNKYEYYNSTIFSKYRDVLSLCHQHFLNIFNLNIKRRKIKFIQYKYIQIEKIKKISLNKELFVINTGGNHKPLYRDYKIQKNIMNKRFNFNIIFDIKDKKQKKYSIDIFNYIFKIHIILILLKKFNNPL